MYIHSLDWDVLKKQHYCHNNHIQINNHRKITSMKNKCSYYPVADIPHPTLVKYISRDSGREQTFLHAFIRRLVI